MIIRISVQCLGIILCLSGENESEIGVGGIVGHEISNSKSDNEILFRVFEALADLLLFLSRHFYSPLLLLLLLFIRHNTCIF